MEEGLGKKKNTQLLWPVLCSEAHQHGMPLGTWTHIQTQSSTEPEQSPTSPLLENRTDPLVAEQGIPLSFCFFP